MQIQEINLGDINYPYLLSQIYSPPKKLYVVGNAEILREKSISIVGCREASEYGKNIAKDLAYNLGRNNIITVSGLARGIDTYCHIGSIKANARTIAVVAHGLDMIYPAQHRQTAADIIKEGGAVITEYPSRTCIHRSNFLARNRIIAALSDCTVVVESARKGGALVTANIAASYGRDVFAFPGRTNDEYSEGCNTLITKNVAALITSADDLIDLMCWERINSKPVQQELFIKLDSNEQMIYDRLSANGTASVNELSLTVKIPVHKLLSILVDMEFRGIIQSLPGNRYALARPI